MSFASLWNSLPVNGEKIKIRGGQSQGHVLVEKEKIAVNRFVPTLGKGSEYAVKFRAEEDEKYFELLDRNAAVNSRHDVTSDEIPSKLLEVEELTSIGTLPNIGELDREELTQVYEDYDFSPVVPTEHLEPIHSERDQILRLIEMNQVCIIKGPTGCGKSTQIPQFILDSYKSRNVHCKIIVTQPRRIAAITLAQHVCHQRGWVPGSIVGYQVALDKSVSKDTRILYCTTGVMLEKLISAKNLNEFTHIVLDEVHEREEDMDFTMMVVKKFLRTTSPKVKVVLMSATIDVSRFAEYFAVSLRNEKQPAPYYEIKPKNTFTVQVHYLDAFEKLGVPLPDIKEDVPEISMDAYMLVPMMIRGFNNIDEVDYKCKRSHDEKGAVLIFLPGLYQIETLFDLLTTEDQKHPDIFKLWLCPLHSSITKDEQENVRKYAPPGMRKVILSTNIAESSITIPDVKYVIDFCLTKHLVADVVTGFTSLQLAWASHTNCVQREGRVGRVQDGRVYRLVPRDFYLFSMSKESMPEMQRCPLELVVLKCKKLIEDECPLRLISNALDPPDLDNYEKTVLKLKEIGALLTTCKGHITPIDGDLTFMGKVMAGLPLDIHITKLILLGHVFDVMDEAIIMGCTMSVRNIFSEPFQKRLEAYNNKLLWADSSESDCIAFLNAYNVWRQMTGIGKFERSRGSQQAWCRRYFLQMKHLEEVAKQEDDIKSRLKQFNIEGPKHKNKPLWNTREKPLILKLVLAGAFYPHYFTRLAQNPNAEGDAVKTLSGHNPYNCVYLQNMPHPAPLYENQVKEAFQKFGISDHVELFHDDSRKLVVKFDPIKSASMQIVLDNSLHDNIPGEIVMPVYRAVKLRQLNLPISVKIFSANQVKEKVAKLSLDSKSSTHSLVRFDCKPQIMLNQNYVEIEVCHVVNAGHFYGHMFTSKDNLWRICQVLNGSNSLHPVYGQLLDDVIYAAPFKETENEPLFYYRARIKQKYSHYQTSVVEVFFIDYGNSTSIPATELRELVNEKEKAELDDIPPCALECVLAEVSPSVWSNQGGDWSDEANKFVTSCLLNRLCCTKIYSYINGIASVYVYNANENNSDQVPRTLNDELIKRGYARHKEESYFSKLNHAKRLSLEEKGEYKSSEISSLEEERVRKSFEIDLRSLPTTTTGARGCIDLKGPNSPLEMKLYSMARCSSQKEVKVEWNSVNSVLLDSDPTDPHERLVVAGWVSQSSDGRRLTLNHTTVLPNMHGLAALVCLMFAPTAELRTDEKFSRYTGALCGLGMSKGLSLFPENDMEIQFDVEFIKDDIVNINKLRYWMNERFCSDDAENIPAHHIMKIQKNIRQLAISLLKPLRRAVKVYYSPTPFMWGIVPEERILSPFPDEETDFEKFIYQLHQGIEINLENGRCEIETLVEKMKVLEAALSRTAVIPRNIYCDICDLNFDYLNQLQMHMTSRVHLDLVKWLHDQAKQLGINIEKPAVSK